MEEDNIRVKEIRKSYISKELAKIIIKPSNDWSFATTVVRENRALNTMLSFFGKKRSDTLSSPASPYPERQNILPREKIKPRRKR
jgi:hypothetical protein|tara:strand:+ start:4922 stop:5176 length:255 start_codon:yes stop_codon:yes gene_type:complete